MQNKSQILTLPFLPLSLNQMLGVNRWKLKKLKDKFQKDVMLFLNLAKLKPYTKPVKIVVILEFATKRRRDYDNYTGGLKWLIDCLCMKKIIPDDNSKYISESPKVIFREAKEDKTIILLKGARNG